MADVIHQTPPPTSASKIPFIESVGTAETAATGAEATGAEATRAATETEATGAETETAEDPNLETIKALNLHEHARCPGTFTGHRWCQFKVTM